MAEKPNIGNLPDQTSLDEIESLEEQGELEDERLMEQLAKDKQRNYSMIKKLRPVTEVDSIALKALISPYTDDYFKSLRELAEFKEWKIVEGGEIQVRESSDNEDMHGYVVIRPEIDPANEIIIRVWNGFPNSAIVLPRSDKPLPHHGRQKDEILEQMRLVSGKELDAYDVWLEQLRKAG